MTYQAIVGALRVSPHPNADRLQVGHICGARVIVGLEAKDGDLYAFFDSDGQLSPEFCKQHDLIGYTDEQGVKRGGYFSDKRRVRAQTFRGVKSEGYAVPISWFEFTGYDISKLKVGDMFDSLNDVPICNKYYTMATRARIDSSPKKTNQLKIDFPQHFETAQYRYAYIEPGSLVHISEKEHGTSFRYGRVPTEQKEPWYRKALMGLCRFISLKVLKMDYHDWQYWEHHLGTRRAILPKKTETEYGGGFYGNGDPYDLAPKKLYGKLKRGEIVYGEIVGYLKTGAALFTHNISSLKELVKLYGDHITYSYGCVEGESRLRVYRITQDGRELSQYELWKRCEELGVEPVTHITSLVYDGDKDKLDAIIQSHTEGSSLIDPRHIREGVCVRVESRDGTKIYKEKSWSFKVAEGIIKDNDTYVDAEEVA
jgi:hypothetical protein